MLDALRESLRGKVSKSGSSAVAPKVAVQQPAPPVALVSLPEYLDGEGNPIYIRTEWKLLCEKRLAVPDRPITDIAGELGFTAQTLRIWLRDPVYQRYENFCISARRDQLVGVPVEYSPRFRTGSVPERFQEYELQMQERLLDIIETTKNEKLQADLSEKWLAMAGHQPKGAATSGTSTHITAEQMVIFVQRAREAGLTDPIQVSEIAVNR